MKIYMDESGFTGADYCNDEQPLFALACNWIDEQDSAIMQQKIVDRLGCSEVKFSKMVKTGKGKGELLKIIDQIGDGQNQKKFAVYIVHKKSALVRKFVLDCIEPALCLNGIDMLENGMSVSYANIISATMPVFMGKIWYDHFLLLYNRLIRSKSEKDNNALYEHCLKAKDNDNASKILIPYLLNPSLVMSELNDAAYRSDMYESIALGLIVHIRNYFNICDFDIVMDSTKATTNKGLSDFLLHLRTLTESHKMSEVCTIYPDIAVSNISMVNSAQSIGVRMSDIIAGLFTWSFKGVDNMESVISKALTMNIADINMIHMINSTNVTPQSLGMDGVKNPWK